METPDRLAAYLADELDPADRTALENELAGDGRLRAELAAMRRADDALATLATPTPDDGFDDRIDTFVGELLGELESDPDTASPAMAATGTTDADTTDADTTDSRRTGWVLAAAAAVILLAGVGVAMQQPFGAEDTAISAVPGLSSLSDEATGDEPAADAESDRDAAGILALPMQPTIVDEQRSLTDDELDTLLTEPVLTEVAAARLDRDEGIAFGLELQRQLGQPAPDAQLESDAAEDGDVTDDAGEAARTDDRLITRSGDPVDGSLLADSQRCLSTLLEAGPTAIPVYVESATVDGRPALVFGLVTIDPQDDGFTRREIWTLERSTCQVLRFAQD